jgi:hypothetical protein
MLMLKGNALHHSWIYYYRNTREINHLRACPLDHSICNRCSGLKWPRCLPETSVIIYEAILQQHEQKKDR